jgi:drug/metabolite transporter (DMT)-like permease
VSGTLRHDRSLLPIACAVAGAALLTGMDAVIKGLAARYPTVDLILARYIAGFLFMVPVVLVVRPPLPDRAMLRAHALRTLVMLCTAFLFFSALRLLPLIEAVVFSYLAPVFMALLARVLLGEKAGASTLAAIGVCFAGVVVIAWGKGVGRDMVGRDLLGVGLALAAAVTYALAMVLLRARSGSDTIVGIVSLQNVFAVACMAPAAAVLGTPSALLGPDWAAFLAVGLLGTLGHLAYAYAFTRAPAAQVGTVEYTSFLWAAALGYLLFGEVPTLSALAGGGLIVTGSLLLLTGRR